MLYSTQFLLQFPGIYTIIEEGLFVRRGRQALPSIIKRYVRVHNRDASHDNTASVGVVYLKVYVSTSITNFNI